MEDLSQWVVTGTWGITTNAAHGGNGSLTDSPFSDYANSSDSYALTAVNLAGTVWPVLRFWDRYPAGESGIMGMWRYRPTGAVGIGSTG